MKALLLFCTAAVAALSLSSCGDCPCNKYNSDYLRDVPVQSTRSFR